MDAYRLHVKLYFEPRTEIDLERLIPVFHRLIRQGLAGELLIDVADYKHVASGPGVMLIAHDANYAVDAVDGRLGVLYGRKRPAEGGFGDRLRDAFARTIRFGLALANEPDLAGLAFATDRWSVRVHDRLLAPNSEATFAAVAPELRGVASDLFPGVEPELTREDDPKACFGVRIAVPVKPALALLAERLATSQMPETCELSEMIAA
jgi:hypothetical protein